MASTKPAAKATKAVNVTKAGASKSAATAAKKPTRSATAMAAKAAVSSAPRSKARLSAKPAQVVANVARSAKAVKPKDVVAAMAGVIESSPVGTATRITKAVNRARKTSQLGKMVRNKVVVVTGATSGIGEDSAIKLAAAGAIVILAARTPEKLDETLDKIRSSGGKAYAYSCDISDMADCDRFVKLVLEKHHHVDVLINNAGRSIRRSVKYSFDRFHDFERTMQLNFFGALRLILGFAPVMLERKSGHIINISSIGVLASPPRFSAYVASKAALDAFTWCTAPEFADSNVRFTTINMPLVKTPMTAPTKLYDAFPMLTPDAAAELVIKAVVDRPKRVATGLGIAGAVAQALTPNLTEFILNQAYHLFPDSAAARGLSDEEAAAEKANLPRSPTALARKLFSQVFAGVHW